MAGKSPINIIQEYFVSKRISPEYEITTKVGGCHRNIFKCRVKCAEYVGEGEGNNKKDAKKNAAEQLLSQIKELNYKSPTKIHSQQNGSITDESEPTTSYINMLQDLCLKSNLRLPEYTLVSVIGPPHKPIFRMACRVGSNVIEEQADTKKKVKHTVAMKMFCHLKGVPCIEEEYIENKSSLKSTIIENELHKNNVTIEQLNINDYPIDKVNEMYKELSTNRNNFSTCQEATIANYQNTIKNKFSEKKLLMFIQMLLQFNETDHEDDIVYHEKIFYKALSVLNLKCTFHNLHTLDKESSMTLLVVNTNPVLNEIGFGKSFSTAKYFAIKHMTQMLINILQ